MKIKQRVSVVLLERKPQVSDFRYFSLFQPIVITDVTNLALKCN